MPLRRSITRIATIIATAVGALVGGVAGYAGGRLDALLSRVSEFVVVLPAIYVTLALRAAMPLVLPGSTIFVLLLTIFALLGWPMVARGVRAIVLVERDREYAVAARAAGASRPGLGGDTCLAWRGCTGTTARDAGRTME